MRFSHTALYLSSPRYAVTITLITSFMCMRCIHEGCHLVYTSRTGHTLTLVCACRDSRATTAAKLPPARRKRTNLAIILRLSIPMMTFFVPFLGSISPVSGNTHHEQWSSNQTPVPPREIFSPQKRPITPGTEDQEYLV